MQQAEKKSEVNALWQELHQVCAQSIELAQDLSSCLRRGTVDNQLTPLLEESAERVGHLRQGIRDLARRGEPVDAEQREYLLDQMRLLLALEEARC